MMNHNNCAVVTLWEGEWLWLRRQVSMMRQWVWLLGGILGSVFDFADYLATARMYTARADNFVTERTALASEQLRTRWWILPTFGIASVSAFVVSKSAPWGTYRALRNGAITSVALTVFLFPREIIAAVDTALPFRVGGEPMEDKLKEK